MDEFLRDHRAMHARSVRFHRVLVLLTWVMLFAIAVFVAVVLWR